MIKREHSLWGTLHAIIAIERMLEMTSNCEPCILLAARSRKSKRAFCLGASGLAVLFFSLTMPGCKEAPRKREIPKPSVRVSKPAKVEIVEWDEFVGRLAAVESVQVRARVGGYLLETKFAEGQLVKAGELLTVIDPRPFQSEVARSEATLEAAKAQLVQANSAVAQARSEADRASVHRDLSQKELQRQITLQKQNATSQQDYEISQAQFAQSEADVAVAKSKIEAAEASILAAEAAMKLAQANLDLAELNLQYTQIRSPIDGRISYRYVTEGNLVSGGGNDATLITSIVSLHPIHCYFDADEQTYLKYQRLSREGKRQSSREVRNPVFIALADEPGTFPHRGHMDFVENRVDEDTGTMRGRAIFPNEDHQLTPGMFARVRLPGSERYEAILVPDKAIGTDQAEKFVMTIDPDNKASRKVVTLGPMSHGLRIIRSGLDGNERVVVSGLQRTRPGMEVDVTEESLELKSDPLPDDYQPVPESEWLTPPRKPAANVISPEAAPTPPSS